MTQPIAGGRPCISGHEPSLSRDYQPRQPELSGMEPMLGRGNRMLGLLRLLQHGNTSMRKMAISALAQPGNRVAVPELVDMLRYHTDAEVRRAAALALERIGDTDSVPALCDALRDPDNGVRWAATQSLGVLGDQQAIPGLINALGDKFGVVRWGARQALTQFGQTALPNLRGALQRTVDPLVREGVIAVLMALEAG